MFSSTTTELSIRREKASASPPSTIELIEPPPKRQSDEGRERGERDREEDGDRRAQAAEEDQDHQRGQEQADRAFVQQRLDRCLDEDRLIEDDLRHELLGNIEEVRDLALDASTTAMVLVSPPCFSTGR